MRLRLKPILVAAFVMAIIVLLVVVIFDNGKGTGSSQEPVPAVSNSTPTQSTTPSEPVREGPASEDLPAPTPSAVPVLPKPCKGKKDLEKRICDFEVANQIIDGKDRCKAIRPYATDRYYKLRPCTGGERGMTATIADVEIDPGEEEEDIRSVTVSYTLVTLRNGQVLNVFRDQQHLTDWAYQKGKWYAFEEGVAQTE